MEEIRVLIVDDSALMRSLIEKIIVSSPVLTVADKAMNGRFALQKLERADPDVILLDLEMPEMNGVEFLKERKRLNIDIPVVILSSIAKEGAKITMDCLELGASDFVTKPSGADSANLHTVAKQIIDFVVAYGRQYQLKRRAGAAQKTPKDLSKLFSPTVSRGKERTSLFPTKKYEKPVPVCEPGNIEIIAIGISTGGPNALRQVFANISEDLPQPIVVVQHMPAGFTEEFAKSLNKICPLEVKEASDGDVIKKGRVLIAPGGRHMVVDKRPLATIAKIIDTPPENGHRPSVDVLFASIAKQFTNRALGIIMTGMGKDGARELTNLYAAGSRTIGQDEASSIVYGMPRVAYDMGGVMEQVSLENMAEAINNYGKKFA
ncbi:chemotaxis response regulator protein-glutamate methylesterase [Treponema phagedenis]|uniref:Protein-glutamate methylesterase/protein-glutamine glutaminase n=1 Tax=Treponema phagedenis TaxID=162 RepID=A0A0B7GRT4_TREPH|nr:chemotaxis response regulator protein-glutamate methylesterase [Treponema phagedenis]EFW39172.1 response regulator receiver domain protein [Treponema phagedenis F0421]NVP25117.1 chemotaxis response regulator protein-glutamate methylesterase [Treponema phagedenis]QEJ94118.1 chemotaxis response regulator protein-glutamate methylesterase [Treponema phagedenis]QEJ97231.1 chemotaxis response regulator protein-glutamate methylesterase [Treponema phagedenis]QEK01871.1 chemotaxis response regulator